MQDKQESEIPKQKDKLSKEEMRKVYILIFLVFLVFLVVFFINTDEILANDKRQRVVKNSYKFNKGISLICPASMFRNTEHYLVNHKTDWKIYKKTHFKKGALLLEIDMCQQQ